jgi:membrane protease YdiL (CAAX protease family)
MPDLNPASTDANPPLSSRQRYISLAELAFGSFLVIGHNIFHLVPNEVPFLFLLFWISALVRKGRWSAAGLKRPSSWPKTILLALAAAAVLVLGSEFVIQPLASHFWHTPENVSSLLKTPVHEWKSALLNLAIVWLFAGFGEEIGYRGYLLTRAADLGNRSNLAYILAMLYVALLFGFGHFYKGPAGVMDSTYSGLVLGSVYLLSGRNLWAPILAHGLVDTVVVVAIFMGWAT